MVRIIIGDYTPKKTELVVDDYNENLMYKNSQNDKTIVIYAEHVGLKKADIQVIAKKATRNMVIVCADYKTANGLRKSKKCSIKQEYDKGELTPFELASYIMGMKDRQYIFDFMKHSKTQLFMVVKALISNHLSFTKANQQWLAYVDSVMWKCRPEIIYALLAFKIKPEVDYNGEPKHKWMTWHYPKIEKDDKKKSKEKRK